MSATRSIHQVIPTLFPRDAVGNHTLGVREVLRSMGLHSEIYALHLHNEMRSQARPLAQLPSDADAVIYQMSIGSQAFEAWARHRGRKLVNYHNITPVQLVGGWDRTLRAEIALGRMQMARGADICEHAICDSDFNRSELDALGYRSTETISVLFDVNAEAPDRKRLRLLRAAKSRSGTQVLFVGRVVPNKAQHHLVAAVKFLRECFDDDAHLHLVGTDGVARYREAVEQIVDLSGMGSHVTFWGHVSAAELTAHYRAADVFCCLSDHEGFCVPVIEAMSHDLPVVALGRAAVTGTVGGAGIVLDDKDLLTVAAALRRVGADAELAQRMSDAGRQRAQEFGRARTEAAFAAAFERFVSRGADVLASQSESRPRTESRTQAESRIQAGSRPEPGFGPATEPRPASQPAGSTAETEA